MNELIPIKISAINGEQIQTCSARELHKFLGIGKDFSNWVKAQIERVSFALPDFTNPAIAAREWAKQYELRQALEHKVRQDAPENSSTGSVWGDLFTKKHMRG